MLITIRIPTPMRKWTRNEGVFSTAATTVEEALSRLVEAYPELRGHLFDSQGNLRKFVNFYLGEEDIRFLNSLSTPLKDGDEISIIPAIAGG